MIIFVNKQRLNVKNAMDFLLETKNIKIVFNCNMKKNFNN